MRAKRRPAMMKECLVCGIEFKVKASHYERRKCCNKKCDGIRKKTLYKGKDNPNYGNTGEKNPMFIGDRLNKFGYKILYKPTHPNSDGYGYVLEHRYVMAEHLGRPLTKEEVVHHIDENRINNSIENLQVMSVGEHTKIHSKDFKLVHNPVNGQIIDVVRRSKINE